MKKRCPNTTSYILAFLLSVEVCAGASRVPLTSQHGMVVSAHYLASEAGKKVLQRGGNAIDAAVAVGFVLAVVYPEAGSLGGGGYLLARMHDGTCPMLDFRSTSPGDISSSYFLDSAKKLNGASVNGHKAVCVPGIVAGLFDAWKKYGTMKFSELLDPSIALAEQGFVVDRRLEHSLASNQDSLMRYPSTVRLISQNGRVCREGDTMKLPDLASTLRRIRQKGKDGFYRGATADLILREMQRGGGLITKKDLEGYEAIVRAPVKGTYRGYELLAPSLSSSGGVCLVELLNILERYDLKSMGFHSSRSVHVMTEAMKRVFADRAEFLGDPAFSRAPVDALISKSYAQRRSREIDTLRSTPSSEVAHGTVEEHEGRHTTHYVVVDAQRNVVAVTITLNDLFGCKVVVDGGGFFLNDDIDDFSIAPNTQNLYGLVGSVANALEPRKRPLSSMSPTIVLKDGKPVLALGARGGPRIITAILQVIVNVIDFGMDIQEAVDAPRFHHQWLPDKLIYDKFCFPADVMTRLTDMGHVLGEADDYLGRLEALSIDSTSTWIYGGPDPREEGVTAGY